VILGCGGATIETVTLPREADGCVGVGRLMRQQTRREIRGERTPLTKG
jgi:hypothetical protein